MVASARSSSRRAAAPAALALLVALGAGCTEELEPLTGTSSLRVELVSPADPGSLDDRLGDEARSVTVTITALDTEGEVDTSFDEEVDVYTHFLGGLTPDLGETPLATVPLSGGTSGEVDLELPAVFGQTFLWVEHTRGDDPSYATGTSPTLWYRDPYLQDVSQPPDEMALDALEASPLQDKQVQVTGSRHGPTGRMVVTGTYAQGYTVSDVACQDEDGTPPCVPGDYDHVFVFTFNRPRGEGGETIVAGDVIDRLTGAITEFNGLTEVGFPQNFVGQGGGEDMVPEPVVLEPGWLDTRIEMERVEAALVAIDGAELCPLDDEYETFAQWKLALGGSCDDRDVVNIITRGQVNDFDPADHVGQVMPRVVGTLRPVNIGSFHVWIVYPRGMSDIVTP